MTKVFMSTGRKIEGKNRIIPFHFLIFIVNISFINKNKIYMNLAAGFTN